MNQPDPRQGPSLLQIIGSVLAAAFGVQSNENRERDFKHGSAGVYIAVGVVGTILFVLTVYGIVQLVLKSQAA